MDKRVVHEREGADMPVVELGLQCGKVAVQGQLGGRVHGLARSWHHSRHGGHHHNPAVPPVPPKIQNFQCIIKIFI